MDNRPLLSIADHDESNESLLIHDIARLAKIDFDRRVRDLGLTRSQWQAVGAVRRNPGISQSELAEKLDIEPISATRTIDRLESAGWVERRPDQNDRRVKRLFLTDRVQDVVAHMRSLALEMRQDALKGVTAEEHAALLTILKRIKSNLCKKK